MTPDPSPGAVARVPVETARGGYPVLVGTGLLAELPALLEEHAPAHRYAVVSDDRVAELYGSGPTSSRSPTARRPRTAASGPASPTRSWKRASGGTAPWWPWAVA